MTFYRIKERVQASQARPAKSVPLHPPKGIASERTKPLKTTKNKIVKHKSKSADTTLFCRHELKYRIPETKARAIAQYVRSYISLDRYSKKYPNHEYPISSLYFDSDKLHLCKETIEGKVNRFKLRIRCYDDLPETTCFFEIKRRFNNVIFKSRACALKTVVGDVIRGGYIPESLYKDGKETVKQFQFYLHMLNARPIVLVRYMRQAFEGDSSNRVRVTFDRQLSFKTTQNPTVTLNGSGWRNVSMNFVVLEIKFTSKYPRWLSDMVKAFDLKQTAMSKYVSSVKQSCELGFCAPTCGIYR